MERSAAPPPAKQLDCNINWWLRSKNPGICIFDDPLLHAACHENPLALDECRQLALLQTSQTKQERGKSKEMTKWEESIGGEGIMSGNVLMDAKAEVERSEKRREVVKEKSMVTRGRVSKDRTCSCSGVPLYFWLSVPSLSNKLVVLREEDSSGSSPSKLSTARDARDEVSGCGFVRSFGWSCCRGVNWNSVSVFLCS